MSLQLVHDGGHRAAPGLIDVTVPNAARVFDFLFGGHDNFAADRKAAAALVESAPSIAAAPAAARAFRRRVVGHLAADAGIRQFLDVGAGMVPAVNTHEIAQAVDPACRIVYIENDPMALAHVNAVVTSAPGGIVTCVDGDVADVNGIVSAAGLSGPMAFPAGLSASGGAIGDDEAILDVSRPVAVLLLSTLSHVPSAEDAAKVVAGLMDPVPSGSYLAISHLASDLDPWLPAALKQWDATAAVPIALRSSAEVEALVTGLDLVPPGLVAADDWRPDESDPPGAAPVPLYGLLARKP